MDESADAYPVSRKEFDGSFNKLQEIVDSRCLLNITLEEKSSLEVPELFKVKRAQTPQEVLNTNEAIWKSCMFRFGLDVFRKMMLLYDTKCRGFVLHHIKSYSGRSFAEELLLRRKLEDGEARERDAWYKRGDLEVFRPVQASNTEAGHPATNTVQTPPSDQSSDSPNSDHSVDTDVGSESDDSQVPDPADPADPAKLTTHNPAELMMLHDTAELAMLHDSARLTSEELATRAYAYNIHKGRHKETQPVKASSTRRSYTKSATTPREPRYGNCAGHVYDNFGVIKKHAYRRDCSKKKDNNDEILKIRTACNSVQKMVQFLNSAQLQHQKDSELTLGKETERCQNEVKNSDHATDLYHVPLGEDIANWRDPEDALKNIKWYIRNNIVLPGYPFYYRKRRLRPNILEFIFTCAHYNVYKNNIKTKRTSAVNARVPLPCQGSLVFRVYLRQRLLVVKHGHRHHNVLPGEQHVQENK